MAEAGATPATTVMIGDTSFDMAMARAAGARAIGVAWGYHDVAELIDGGRGSSSRRVSRDAAGAAAHEPTTTRARGAAGSRSRCVAARRASAGAVFGLVLIARAVDAGAEAARHRDRAVGAG